MCSIDETLGQLHLHCCTSLMFSRYFTQKECYFVKCRAIFGTVVGRFLNGELSAKLKGIGLLQLTITWYKIRHAGGQAHYYSPTGTLKQR